MQDHWGHPALPPEKLRLPVTSLPSAPREDTSDIVPS